MEQTAKEFLDYLCYIGLISEDSIHIFLNNLNLNVNTSEKIKEILINSLFSFFKTLPENNQKIMSIKLVNKFFEHKLKANYNLIKKLLYIYEKTRTYIKKMYYNHWYFNTFNYDMNKMIEFYKKNNIDNLFKHKNNINNKLNLDNNNNINNNHINNNYSNDIEINSINNNLFTFQGSRSSQKSLENIRNNLNIKKNISNNKRSKSNNISRDILHDFINRQDEYIKHIKRNKEKLIKRNEDEYSKKYTFSPHITKQSFDKNYELTSNSNNYSKDQNQNIYEKLYEDSNRRQIIRNQKILDYVNRIKSESNLSKDGKSLKKVIDKNKIEKLYNDYKQKKTKRRELLNKIDKEKGITFKPYIKKKNKKK